MTVTYENFQDLESEEKVQGVRNGLPPPQSLLQHLRSGPCLLLLSLGLGLLLLVIICVVGSQNSKFQRDLVTLRTDFSNFTSNTVAEIQALTSQGSSVEEMIASLKAEVEVIKQEQQAVHSEMLLRVQRLMQDLNKLTCQVATLKNNASTERTCCPINWVEHQDSCYWFSHSGMPWAEAEKHCQLEDAHLVVINSREEQVRASGTQFLRQVPFREVVLNLGRTLESFESFQNDRHLCHTLRDLIGLSIQGNIPKLLS
uniref:C-type lectin domain containing 10A n=1 Tax=Rhinopithecus roxellana TaxID=61622 RepID=A0A2K6QAM4_RHIRO